MSTNARFLEDDYMMSNNVRSKFNLRYLDKTPTTTHNTMDLVPTIHILVHRYLVIVGGLLYYQIY